MSRHLLETSMGVIDIDRVVRRYIADWLQNSAHGSELTSKMLGEVLATQAGATEMTYSAIGDLVRELLDDGKLDQRQFVAESAAKLAEMQKRKR